MGVSTNLIKETMTRVSNIIEREVMKVQAILNFPTDTVKELFDTLPTGSHSEIEVERFLDERMGLIVGGIYASPSLVGLRDADWRIVAETKTNVNSNIVCEVDSLTLMSPEGVAIHKRMQCRNQVYPVKSLTLQDHKKAWCSCVVEKYVER